MICLSIDNNYDYHNQINGFEYYNSILFGTFTSTVTGYYYCFMVYGVHIIYRSEVPTIIYFYFPLT